MSSYNPITNILNFAVSLNPTAAFPLDARSMFGSYAAASAAAATAEMPGSSNTVYYIGQTLTVIENDVVGYYQIQADKSLKAVGASIVGDNKTISVSNNTVSLKSFGTEYYKYVEEFEDTPAHYELTKGWKAGLEPRVVASEDDNYELAWYEPASTTVEGLSSSIATLNNEIESIKQTHSNDKLTLEGYISSNTSAIQTNTEAITKLNADAGTDGSVKNQIAAAIAGIVENPDETMNSIQELVDWCTNHAEDAIQLQNNVTANTTAIAGINTLLGIELPSGISANTVIGYITEVYNGLDARLKILEDAALNPEDFATAEQGKLAESAVQDVKSSGTNGYVNVDGLDIKVYELPKADINTVGGIKPDGTSITTNGEGVASVNAVDYTKVTGLSDQINNAKTEAVTEVKDYSNETFVAVSNIANSSNLSTEAASDSKVISEKVFIDAMTWKNTM